MCYFSRFVRPALNAHHLPGLFLSRAPRPFLLPLAPPPLPSIGLRSATNVVSEMCKVEMAHRYMWRPYLERARESIWSQYVIFMITDYAMVSELVENTRPSGWGPVQTRGSGVYPRRPCVGLFFFLQQETPRSETCGVVDTTAVCVSLAGMSSPPRFLSPFALLKGFLGSWGFSSPSLLMKYRWLYRRRVLTRMHGLDTRMVHRSNPNQPRGYKRRTRRAKRWPSASPRPRKAAST